MVVLSLGSNLGDRFQNMKAMEQGAERILSGTIRRSPLYETDPVGVGSDHAPYLNRVVAGDFDGSPQELLELTHALESALGRTGKGTLAPRTADIDILLFHDIQLVSADLTIPHHALFQRRFEIAGTMAVVPEMKIPGREILFNQYEITDSLLLQNIRIVKERE